MNALKSFAILALTLASTSAFALGRTDTNAIDPTLQELESSGFDCIQKYPANWGDTEAGGTFVVSVVCRHASSEKMNGTIVMKVISDINAKCRDLTALSIDIK